LLAQERKVRNRKALPPYTIEHILLWADAHYLATKEWPKCYSGKISAAPGETWAAVETALQKGQRSLPGGSSLAKLLTQERKIRNEQDLPPFRQKQILAWADAHFKRMGTWPSNKCGAIVEAPGETWTAVDTALSRGIRGCRGGSSLAQLLARRRGVRNIGALPPLTEKQILVWARAHHRRTRQWPNRDSGPIARTRGETWNGVNAALNRGGRGLPGGSSLARLLAQHRGVPHLRERPKLTIEQILAWADAHYRSEGQWPHKRSGPITGVPKTTWLAVDAALRRGSHGLPGGTSLCLLLRQCRREA
jgi:hypothetical protein